LTPRFELSNRIPFPAFHTGRGWTGKNNFYRILKKYKRILSMTPLAIGGSGKRINSTEFPQNSKEKTLVFNS